MTDDVTSYVCEACGEEVSVPVDRSGGSEQEYVEDCPICCRPHVLRVHFERDGSVSIESRAE